jgi:hypothetical protein
MPDFLEQFGERINGWSGQPIGNRLASFYIYRRGEEYFGICLIDNSFYSQPFDHLPSPYEVETHFQTDERLKKHFRM